MIPFLPKGAFQFAEPCAGDGRLVNHIQKHTNGQAALISDIDPNGVVTMLRDEGKVPTRTDVIQRDAFSITETDLQNVDMVITNPPWSRDKESDYILHKLIEHFSRWRPTWFLFDADWAHTVQAQPYLQRCTHIVSIGRVRWIEDSQMSGKDNCAWYCFQPQGVEMGEAPRFYGRDIHP